MKNTVHYIIAFICLYGAQCIGSQNLEEVFTSIYQAHKWGGYPETVSGTGSTLKQTEKVRILLDSLLHELSIKTLLDVPCGDFNWMKTVNLSNTRYIGMDIVKGLVETNQQKYGSATVSFCHGNASVCQLPATDLIVCRDLFLHIKFEDIKKILSNFKKSGSKYLLASTYAKTTVNVDRQEVNNAFRPINLELPPFNLPKPLVLIAEDIDTKFLGLWHINDIPDFE